MLRVLVIDAQGGGLGKALVEAVKRAYPELPLTAVGTNSAATAAMRKAGADAVATGENAACYNAARSDLIIGGIGIIGANAMMGEITPAIAAAVSASDAVKVLVPNGKCNFYVAGVKAGPLQEKLDDVVVKIQEIMEGADEEVLARHRSGKRLPPLRFAGMDDIFIALRLGARCFPGLVIRRDVFCWSGCLS